MDDLIDLLIAETVWICKRPDCGRPFVPDDSGRRKYCGLYCRQAVNRVASRRRMERMRSCVVRREVEPDHTRCRLKMRPDHTEAFRRRRKRPEAKPDPFRVRAVRAHDRKAGRPQYASHYRAEKGKTWVSDRDLARVESIKGEGHGVGLYPSMRRFVTELDGQGHDGPFEGRTCPIGYPPFGEAERAWQASHPKWWLTEPVELPMRSVEPRWIERYDWQLRAVVRESRPEVLAMVRAVVPPAFYGRKLTVPSALTL
jgi:hypothetical protein